MFKIPLLSAVLLVPLNCVDISIPIGCTDEEPREASIEVEGKACASRRQDLDEIEISYVVSVEVTDSSGEINVPHRRRR
ncbi:MAG: hypothetical protein VYE73_07235 [Acidobacteriota bacterium]|nr:hypothetical protein [Acidobacteriota bacterium]